MKRIHTRLSKGDTLPHPFWAAVEVWVQTQKPRELSQIGVGVVLDYSKREN